jgi:hypothetical protein
MSVVAIAGRVRPTLLFAGPKTAVGSTRPHAPPYQRPADITGNLIASAAGFAALRDYARLGVL